MLASIQQGRPFKFSPEDSKISTPERAELKISNALANLAIADHDIVAVATVRSAEELNVIACSHSESNDKSPLSPSPKLPSHNWWNLIFAKNPRSHDKRDTSKNVPFILDGKAHAAEALPGLDDDEAKLRAHIESRR